MPQACAFFPSRVIAVVGELALSTKAANPQCAHADPGPRRGHAALQKTELLVDNAASTVLNSRAYVFHGCAVAPCVIYAYFWRALRAAYLESRAAF